jgi:hypothetical protein
LLLPVFAPLMFFFGLGGGFFWVGAPPKARLSFPNGIAYSLYGPRLYINEFVNESTSALPRRAIVREIILEASK